MRRNALAPAKSVEILLLESPEAFTTALLGRGPLAEQNHLIARGRDETVRRFALRALRRLRRMLRTPNQISSISYLFSGDEGDSRVRTRLLRALLATLARRGALRVVGPRQSTAAIFGYLDALSPCLPTGASIEARIAPTGFTFTSGSSDRSHLAAPF